MSTSTLDLFSLKGKNAIFTGATGGLGLTMALALADAGANIISIQLHADPLGPGLRDAINAIRGNISIFECDIKDHQSIHEAFEAIWKSGVVPDVLVNCAGITRHKKVEETLVKDLDDVMAINFRATYLTIQEFGRELLRLGRPGKIINIASMASYLAQTDISVYASSKSAVRNLTRAVSNEWAIKGITCNCISPGFIQTKMSEDLWKNEEFSARVKDRTSIGRWGTPEDLRGVIVFLASSASDFITGESIVVDGGVLGR